MITKEFYIYPVYIIVHGDGGGIMDFWKMHGTGNDFILINNIDSKFCCGSSGKDKPDNVEGIECAAYAGLAGIAKKVCSRHFGIGADGLIAAEASETADIRMVYYNSDGSAAAMCGNGIRCFSKFVRDSGIVNKDSFSVETGDGIKKVSIISNDAVVSVIRAEMGYYSYPENIRIPLSDKTVLNGLYEEQNYVDLVFMSVGYRTVFYL